MAEKKTTTRSTRAQTETSAEINDSVVAPVEPTKLIPKDVDIHQFITVRNGFHGRLIFISKRTGEEFYWDHFGDEQDIELIDLKSAKSSSKDFFVNNYFMFNEEDEWVIDYLGVRQFYQSGITADNYDELFSKAPAEVEKIIGKMTPGQRRSVAYRASQLIADDKIDSYKVILTLEKYLGIELIEK